MNVPRIVCAAILHKPTGKIVCGPRHYDERMVEQTGMAEMWRQSADVLQGFVDAWGQFHNREVAWDIADKHGQILKDRDWQTGRLHSEHLY